MTTSEIETNHLLGLASMLFLLGILMKLLSSKFDFVSLLGNVMFLFSFYSLYKYINASSSVKTHPNAWKVALGVGASFFFFASIVTISSAYMNAEIWRGSGKSLVDNFGSILESIKSLIQWVVQFNR